MSAASRLAASWRGAQDLVNRADRWQQRRRATALPVAVAVRYAADSGGRWAALLTYYGFFSLLPGLLVLVTVMGFVLQGNPAWQERILTTAAADVPVLGQQLRADVTSLRGSVGAVLVGLLGALYGGGAVLRTAHDALDTVAGTPPTSRSDYLRRHARVALVGGVVLAVTVLAAVAGALTSGASSLPGLARSASSAVSLLLGTLVLLVAFRLLPSGRRRWRDVAPGAVVGAAGWSAVHAVGGLYLDRVVRDAGLTYGAFAVVIGLFAWLYLQARVFLMAAELNAVLATRGWPRSFLGT